MRKSYNHNWLHVHMLLNNPKMRLYFNIAGRANNRANSLKGARWWSKRPCDSPNRPKYIWTDSPVWNNNSCI